MSTENIQVAVRFRPFTPSESDDSDSSSIWSVTKTSVFLRPEALHYLAADKRLPSASHPSFQFDYAFSAEDDNRSVYETMVKRMVLSTLEGYNATVFAYGQTGSGKTYTMLGVRDEENEGGIEEDLTPRTTSSGKREAVLCRSDSRKAGKFAGALTVRNRSLTPVRQDSSLRSFATPIKSVPQKGIIVYSLEDIFREMQESSTKHYFFNCSYLEIYNEHIFDLLKTTQDMKSEILTIIEGTDKEFCVRGLSDHVVTSIDEVMAKLEKGEANRHYAATNMNHNSSRSHTIFRLTIKSLQVVQGTDAEDAKSENLENVTTESILNFVDLAGSERVGNLQAASDPDKSRNSSSFQCSTKSDLDKIIAESKNINTSLFYLCQVISKLAEQKLGLVKSDSHIPFRNSNLTKILRSSLGGNARTCILCTATPLMSQFEQTISTLRFGSSARSITNKVRANVKRETSAQILIAYEQDVTTLRKELEMSTQRGRLAISESSQLRQHLENRIKRFTQLLYERTRPVTSEDLRPLFGLWTKTAGDLIPSAGLVKERVKDPPSILKCDENGLFAAQVWKQVSNRFKATKTTISETSATVLSYKTMKQELETCCRSGDSQRTKKKQYKDLLRKHQDALKDVRTRVNQYEHQLGFDKLPDRELEALEATFLLGLDRVKQAKSLLRVDSLIQKLKERLLVHITEEEVIELMSDGGDLRELAPRTMMDLREKELSSIKGSFVQETVDSFARESQWEEGSEIQSSDNDD